MGTDIHLYVEKLDRYSKPPKWRMMIHEDAAYGDRHYDVFAVLANVRNGIGFAGVDTGDGFKSISEPRGLPDDVSDAVRESMSGGHSFSWLMLPEILGYDWTQTTRKRGWIQAPELLWMLRAGDKAPRSYCGGVSGRDVRHVSREFMEQQMLALGDPPPAVIEFISKPGYGNDVFGALRSGIEWFKPLQHMYAPVEWTETYEEACSPFLKWARGLVDKENPAAFYDWYAKDVRLVFGFDS